MKLHANDKNGYICTSTKYKKQKEFKNHLIEQFKKNGFVEVASIPSKKIEIDLKTLKITKD